MTGLPYLSVRHACQPSRDAPNRQPIYRPGQIVLQTGRRIHAYSLRTIYVTQRRANSCQKIRFSHKNLPLDKTYIL